MFFRGAIFVPNFRASKALIKNQKRFGRDRSLFDSDKECPVSDKEISLLLGIQRTSTPLSFVTPEPRLQASLATAISASPATNAALVCASGSKWLPTVRARGWLPAKRTWETRVALRSQIHIRFPLEAFSGFGFGRVG